MSGFLYSFMTMKKPIIITALFLASCFVGFGTGENTTCTNVDLDLAACYQLYQPINYNNLTSTWLQNCQNIECFLQCVSDAIGSCDRTDKYFSYDLNVLTVSYRAACDQFDFNLRSLLACQPYNVSCLLSKGTLSVAQEAYAFFLNASYAEYKEAQCNYSVLAMSCISPQVTNSCSTDVAAFYEALLRVSLSLAHCGIPQDHDYFTTYGGPLNCITPNTFGTPPPSTSTSTGPSTVSSISSISTELTSPSEMPTSSSSLSTTTTTPTSSSISESSSSSSMTETTSVGFAATSTQSLNDTYSPLSTIIGFTSTLTSSAPKSSTGVADETGTASATLPPPASSSTSSSTTEDPCSNVESDVRVCYELYQPVKTVQELSRLPEYCQNVECFLQCMSNAIDGCTSMDRYITYDMNTIIVTSRAACNNSELYFNSLLACQRYNISCLISNGAISLAQDVSHYLNNSSYAEYREAVCNYATLSMNCLAVEGTENCTAETAEFYEGLTRVSSSLSQCGISQDHAYFTTYGGPINCTTPNTVGTSSTYGATTSTSSSSSTNVPTTSSSTLSTALSSPSTSPTTVFTSTTTMSETSTTSTATPTSSTQQAVTTVSSTITSSSTTVSSSTPASATTTRTTTTTTRRTGCSSSAITSSLAKCVTITLEDIAASSTLDLLTNYCNDLECNIQCYTDAVGNCYKEDQFFSFDSPVFKVTSRAYCSDVKGTLEALMNCQMTDIACYTTFADSVQTDVVSQYNVQNFTAYRQAYCTALTTFQSCVAFSTSSSCPSVLAQLAEDLYITSTSYGKCMSPNHPYFMTYGQDVTSGGTTPVVDFWIWIQLLTMMLITYTLQQ